MAVSPLGATVFHPTWSPDELLERKGSRTVSVVIPALNEQDTVAGVVASVRGLLGGLVDELLVVDSGSIDRTVADARAAGATVYTREEALPGVRPRPGKGEVLWRSLAVARGDLIVFVDSDLVAPSPLFVPSLLAPLLADDELCLVKGFYRRPLAGSGPGGLGGGRVTELLARPLLTALVPDLADLIQPLGGEYAATREFLTAIPFAPGYGVEIGIVLDAWKRRGARAIGQVDLGIRVHRNRPTHELAAMSRQVVATLLARLGIPDSGVALRQYLPHGSRWLTTDTDLDLHDRPAMATLIDVLATADGAVPPEIGVH
ncbi:glucosyl-3-phosphoglycerate synthase [Nocardia tenerifensis]|uniref:Glucosyl-3-phosphoglycerate synthase n=1 Tax=Nocardia tenerifensis TaxID=228006 RepID=A0A318JMY8_9NOCA|nr:glucosyl-3-phosphoglycerate synthase [Nocardia tenerifensis]PXX52167.1 glucosyl-3-phosphoglycerate synthase [Nocardia tenerifensis]